MRKLKLVFPLILTLIFFSCSVLNSDSKSSKIIGQWNRIESAGGFFGRVLTPDSADFINVQFKFNSRRTFSIFRADTLAFSGTYLFKKRDGELIIKYNAKNDALYPFDQRIQFKGRDTLILADECFDCYINTYVRAK